MSDEQFYEERGNYRICSCGPKDDRVYVAWVKGKWHASSFKPIGYFREGSNEQKLQAAKDACNDYGRLKKEG